MPASPTFAVTTGIQIVGSISLPEGFVPIEGRPPLWLENGSEIAVIGTANGHTTVLGLSGPAWNNQRVLASETGNDAAEQGSIVDLAASPDGMTLATAVVPAGADHLDIMLRDVIANGPGHPIATFDGRYDSVSMSWLNSSTIAVALRQRPEPSADSGEPVATPEASPSETALARPTGGLQLVVTAGAGSVAPMNLPGCEMSRLSWSVHGIFAIGEGDSATRAVVVDRRHSTCRQFPARTPIRVLAWSHTDEGSFLYVQPGPGGAPAVFSYDLEHGRGSLVAGYSSAAAFTASGSILALGNQRFGTRRVAEQPNQKAIAQLAIIDESQSEVDLKSLGFETTPAMLAQSSMIYTLESDRAAIETYSPEPAPMRKVLTYSVGSENAFQVAFGPIRGIAELSWSPKGRWLAIEDSSEGRSALTVIVPPG